MTSLIIESLAISICLLFGCVGEIITEKSGHLNLGIPGIMCIGTAGGCFGVVLYMSAAGTSASAFFAILCAILMSALFSAALGAIYCFLTVTLKCNQNITGLAVTTFGVGFTEFFRNEVIKQINPSYQVNLSQAAKFFDHLFPEPFYSDTGVLGWLGQVFLSHGFMFYFAIIIAIAVAVILKHTRIGLNLTAIGENPAAADAVGINVTKYKYAAILSGSAIAGFGGLYYILDKIGGTWSNSSPIEGYGWMSIALVIFTLWRPILSIFGSIIFSALYIVAVKITGVSIVEKMLLQELTPYVVTIIVLIITSVFGSKNVQPPKSLGLTYFREER